MSIIGSVAESAAPIAAAADTTTLAALLIHCGTSLVQARLLVAQQL
jgi:hypothetical protein